MRAIQFVHDVSIYTHNGMPNFWLELVQMLARFASLDKNWRSILSELRNLFPATAREELDSPRASLIECQIGCPDRCLFVVGLGFVRRASIQIRSFPAARSALPWFTCCSGPSGRLNKQTAITNWTKCSLKRAQPIANGLLFARSGAPI